MLTYLAKYSYTSLLYDPSVFKGSKIRHFFLSDWHGRCFGRVHNNMTIYTKVLQ